MTREVRELIADLEAAGWSFSRTRKGHLQGVHPKSKGVLVISRTPSDWRATANVRSTARRLIS